jgi:2-oxoglutarate dehydrogenase complex dehydrogenase (E1) component-like enzyme
MRQHNLRYIGREESASPATGSHKQHDKEQKAILDEVFSSQFVPTN